MILREAQGEKMNRKCCILGLGILIFSIDLIPFDEELSIAVGAVGMACILVGITSKE